MTDWGKAKKKKKTETRFRKKWNATEDCVVYNFTMMSGRESCSSSAYTNWEGRYIEAKYEFKKWITCDLTISFFSYLWYSAKWMPDWLMILQGNDWLHEWLFIASVIDFLVVW